jgi:HEAT repeat protein
LDLGNSASNALWREGDPAIPALVEVLTDEDLDPEVRLRAAVSLGLMAANQRAKPEAFSDEAVPALLDVIQKECKESNTHVSLDCINLRNQSMNALASMGEAGWVAIPVLIKLLEDENMGIQAGAVIALGRMGPKAKEAIPRLEEMSRFSESENLKMHANEALKKIRG